MGDATSMTDCAKLVKEKRPTANGATFRDGYYGPTDKKCYAEFGMTSSNGNRNHYTCYLYPGVSGPRIALGFRVCGTPTILALRAVAFPLWCWRVRCSACCLVVPAATRARGLRVCAGVTQRIARGAQLADLVHAVSVSQVAKAR